MRLYFAGAETPVWRKLLLNEGVEAVALSFKALRARLPKTKPYLLEDRLPVGVAVCVESGAAALLKAGVGPFEAREYLSAYARFLDHNAGRIDFATELDGVPAAGARDLLRDIVGPGKLVVVWHPDDGVNGLHRLCDEWPRVGIRDTVLRTGSSLERSLVRHGAVTKLHAVGTTRPENLRRLRFSTASTTSWLAPRRYGETVIWDGQRLKRYPARYREQARVRHRGDIRVAGFDPAKVEQDDRTETLRLAIWSFRRMEEAVSHDRPKVRRTPTAFVDALNSAIEEETQPQAFVETALEPVDNGVQADRNPLPRTDRQMLPVIGMERVSTVVEGEDGHPVRQTSDAVALASQTARRCDTCHIQTTCPAMRPGHACAFDIPIEIRTPEQMRAVLRGMVEMQTQRVLFGRFAEELEGGYPDPNVSVELERLFRLVEKMKDIEDTRDLLQVNVKARAGAGALSRLFGSSLPPAQLPNGGYAPHATDVVLDALDAE